MKSLACSLMSVGLTLALSTQAGATLIAEHNGDGNPTSGTPTVWTLGGGGGGTSAGGDAGPPASWRITDEALGKSIFYSYGTSAAERLDATTNGWTLTANVRVNDADDEIGDSGMTVEYMVDGGTWYKMEFGSNASGETIVGLHLGSAAEVTHTLVGSTTSEFHLYQLAFNPLSGNADLFVDGVEVISDVNPRTGTVNRVIFGALSSTGLGDANYSQVRFESGIVPEPAALGLLGLGAIALLGGRTRPE